VVIFGLVAGGRLDGNTAAATADLLHGAEFGGARGKVELLTPGTVQPIGDCGPCVRRGSCGIEDGFDSIMERVYAADCLVLGTPLYWYGPSAQLKAFIDRWSCLLDLEEEMFRERMRGKRAVLVLAQGERGFYEAAPALQMLEWSARYLDMPLVGRIVVVGHARSDYRSDRVQRDLVLEAGREIGSGRTADVMPPWFHLRHEPGAPLGGTYSAGRATEK
jgi:multimeric flavodoxin WrbA